MSLYILYKFKILNDNIPRIPLGCSTIIISEYEKQQTYCPRTTTGTYGSHLYTTMGTNPRTPSDQRRRLSSFHLLEHSPQESGDATPRLISRTVGDARRRISLAALTETPRTLHVPQTGQTPVTPRFTTARKNTHHKLSREEVTALYSDTIKLCQDNKINVKNTWSLNLIDYMGMLVRNEDSATPSSSAPRRTSTETNFQLAGVTLDAGVKIYCSRVDSVHSNAYRVLGGLSRTAAGAYRDTEETNSDEDEAGGEKKRKHRPRGDATLVSNMATITVRKLEADLVIDPLFQKMSEAFDDGGAKGMLTNNLHIESSGYILFDSAECAETTVTADAEDAVTYDPEEDAASFDMSHNLTLCPDFIAYFNSKQTDAPMPAKTVSFADVDDNSSQQLSTVSFEYDEGDLASGTGFVPPPAPFEDSFDDFDDAVADHDDFQPERFDNDSTAAPRTSLAAVQGGADLVEAGLSLTADSEYAFFDDKALSGWAGPQHWQFRSTRQSSTSVARSSTVESKRPRSKTAMLLDFSADAPKIDFAAQFKQSKSRTGNQLSAGVLDAFAAKKTTLPEDLHYSTKHLATLFLLPNIRVALDGSSRTVAATTGDSGEAQSQWYDYDNELDAENFVEDFDSGTPGLPDNEVMGISSAVDSLSGVHLIPQPDKVDLVDISYAKVAKKVDVRRLKSGLWSQLCGGDKDDTIEGKLEVKDADDEPDGSTKAESGDIPRAAHPNKDIRSGVTQTLTNIVQDLPSFVPAKAMGDVSFPYVFICLLHLANEKTLSIEPVEDNLNDLVVSKDGGS